MEHVHYSGKYNVFADHGLSDADPGKAKSFFYYHNFIAFIIILIALIAAQFWEQFIYQLIIDFWGMENLSLKLLIVSIFFTIVLFFITYYVFKVPIAAAFTY